MLEPEPGDVQEVRRLEGDPESGWGHALAWVGEELAISQPFAAPGAVLREDGSAWLSGEGQDLLGLSLAGGESLVVGAPRAQGDGAVLVDGQPVLQGGGVGWGVVRQPEGVAALASGGCVQSTQAEGWCVGERLYSLASVQLAQDAEPVLVAGMVRGGLAWEGAVHPRGEPDQELGLAVVGCDLDGDGDEDLVVGSPGIHQVHAWLVDALPDELPDPDVVFEGEGRFGHALACSPDGLWVGAPEAGSDRQGQVVLLRGEQRLVVDGERSTERLGAAIAASGTQAALASAGGRVRVVTAP